MVTNFLWVTLGVSIHPLEGMGLFAPPLIRDPQIGAVFQDLG